MLDQETKNLLEIKGEVLKSILNDLNTDRNAITTSIINDNTKSDSLMYVSSLESLIRQLISYQTLLERI